VSVALDSWVDRVTRLRHQQLGLGMLIGGLLHRLIQLPDLLVQHRQQPE
jgi:peptidoglycan biosynthesis protein MviN/MurJ (putative lipid II flippase)